MGSCHTAGRFCRFALDVTLEVLAIPIAVTPLVAIHPKGFVDTEDSLMSCGRRPMNEADYGGASF